MTWESVGIFWFWQMIVGILVVPVSWLIMSYIIPKDILGRYFKEPHFGPTELIVFASFAGTLLRGSIFVASIVMPQFGRKRQMTDVPKYAPTWYRMTCYVFFYGVFLGIGCTWVLLFLILLIMLPFVG